MTPDLLTTRRDREKKGEDKKGDETKEKVIYIHEKTDVFAHRSKDMELGIVS